MISSIRPSFAQFKKMARRGNLVPVMMDVLADQLTPVALFTAKGKKSPYGFLLESVEGGESLGRYSIVSFEPDQILLERQGRSEFRSPKGKLLKQINKPAWSALRDVMKKIKPVPMAGLPRFYGGAVGYGSYEMVHHFERLPQSNPDPLKWPTSLFFLTRDLFVFDNTQQLLKLVTCVHLKKGVSLKKLYAQARQRLLKNLRELEHLKKGPVVARAPKARRKPEPFTSNINRADYMQSVRKAKEYISAGDVIQVVLSRRNEKKTWARPLDIYRSLRVVNPSPYMYLLQIKDRAVIGSSPESLVRLEQGQAMTRPIAGTRRRGATPKLDEALEKDLLHDKKERAEHVMLVDLGRNDLGRVCHFGSVRTPIFMTVERYSHVMHIVSEVTGQMKPGADAFDLLRAVFPAGTVSGAPKIRAMEIIDELEPDQRGPYSGALGYVSYSGDMDMAITIRSIVWDQGCVSIQTGAGIVADSDPACEFDETENKAAGMKATIEMAESGQLS